MNILQLSGVHMLFCDECPILYNIQTWPSIVVKIEEYKRSIRQNNKQLVSQPFDRLQ